MEVEEPRETHSRVQPLQPGPAWGLPRVGGAGPREGRNTW